MNQLTIFLGWIEAEKEAEPELRKLGVGGRMTHNGIRGCFEGCEVTEDVMENLIDMGYPKFYPNCFTAVDENGKRLPRERQAYWAWHEKARERKKQ